MAIETKPYDTAEFLDSDEIIAAYLSEELSNNEPFYMAKALAAVGRARGGMNKVAEQAAVREDELCRAADKDHLDVDLTIKITKALLAHFSASVAA